MQCTSPLHLHRPYTKPTMLGLNFKRFPQGIDVPCGKCLACRINRAQQWAIRLVHEQRYWNKSCFITLTYRDESLPKDNSICKSSLQKFFKRLRKWYADKKDLRNLKYFANGEYGEDEGRPHYHAIIFGIDISEMEVTNYGGDKILCAGSIFDCWRFGNVYISGVGFESCRYVTGYVAKPKMLKHFEGTDKQKPFQLVSHGMGERTVLAQADKYRENLGITINGKPYGLPRYYKKKLNLRSEDFKNVIQEKKVDLYEHYYRRGAKNGDDVENMIRKARKQSEANLRAKDIIRIQRDTSHH